MKLAITFLALLLLAHPGTAQTPQHQHDPQVRPEAPAPNCLDRVRQASVALDRAAQQIESGRQLNDPAALRASTDNLQLTIAEARQQLQQCFVSAGAASAPAPPATGHEHHAETPAAAVKEAIDPVCQMKVDPKTAPTATYQGQTYYFCSTRDRDIFLKNPAQFIKKE